MKSLRLIPVVIAATTALLLFKGIDLMSGGGYVVTGVAEARAEGAAKPAEGAAPAGDATPSDVNAVDTSPTIADTSITLPATDSAAAAGHGADAATAGAAEGHSAGGDAAAEAPPADAAALPPDSVPFCPPTPSTPSAKDESKAPETTPEGAPVDCTPLPTTAAGDAIPMVTNGQGQIVPLADANGGGSEQQILDRLGQRRTELDKRASDLDMREALLQAAEKQLADQTAALKALQDQVNSKVASNDAADTAQLASLVSMYETMKPKDAAIIFSQLDMSTLVRVAKALNPRKMGPILARMDTGKAEALTANLAADAQAQSTSGGAPDPAALPQIVGK